MPGLMPGVRAAGTAHSERRNSPARIFARLSLFAGGTVELDPETWSHRLERYEAPEACAWTGVVEAGIDKLEAGSRRKEDRHGLRVDVRKLQTMDAAVAAAAVPLC